ncbi:MAG: transposase [Coxiellaceae bacterium]|nr:MAG: transposase [Coxiellaceae bacterium]
MPRPLRIEYEDAWYHVMNRGAGRAKIYETVEHRNIFLELLGDASRLFGIEVHAYCLMDNHYHLLIKTPRGNLARAMRHINGLYTQRYNRTKKTDGALFRGRYKAIVVDKDAYLLQVSRYIHLNPLEAKLVELAEKYTWSSYRYYIRGKNKPAWLKTEEILSMVGNRNKVEIYKRFVNRGIDEETKEFYALANTPMILGKKVFKEELLSNLDEKKIKSSMSDYKNTRELPSIKRVSEVCASYFKVREEELYRGIQGRRNIERKIAIYGCRAWSSEKLSTIAHWYGGTSHANISNVVKEMSKILRDNKQMKKVLEEIRRRVFE